MNSFRININLILNFIILINFSHTSPTEFRIQDSIKDMPPTNGAVTSFALPSEEKYVNVDSYWMAFINYTYHDGETVKSSEGEIGKFGEGKILNVTGKLVHVTSNTDEDNHTGCDSDFNGEQTIPWIALIKRGNCNFEVKVKNAYAKKALGVIIYNDKDTQTLDKMKIDDKERHITAVFISKSNGEEMAKLLQQFQLNVSIAEGTKCTKPANINRTSVLFVSISFIVLMIISLVWLVFYYVQRFRYLQTKDKQSRRLCNVAKRIISKIPTKSIKSDDKEVENDCCAICIEPYRVADFIRVLPCKHEFHKNCIDPWLLEHRTCPMCKMDILKHYGFVFTGSQESILQLDLDTEEGDGDAISISSPRRDGVSPLPQIRSMEHQLSRSSSVDSDSDRDTSSPNERTPTLNKGRNWIKSSAASHANEICVGCIAAALTKQNSADIPDDILNHHGHGNHSAATTIEQQQQNQQQQQQQQQTGPSSLPSTLKKYKGHHSTGSCRGFKFLNNQNSNQIQNFRNNYQQQQPLNNHNHPTGSTTSSSNHDDTNDKETCDGNSIRGDSENLIQQNEKLDKN